MRPEVVTGIGVVRVLAAPAPDGPTATVQIRQARIPPLGSPRARVTVCRALEIALGLPVVSWSYDDGWDGVSLPAPAPVRVFVRCDFTRRFP